MGPSPQRVNPKRLVYDEFLRIFLFFPERESTKEALKKRRKAKQKRKKIKKVRPQTKSVSAAEPQLSPPDVCDIKKPIDENSEACGSK